MRVVLGLGVGDLLAEAPVLALDAEEVADRVQGRDVTLGGMTAGGRRSRTGPAGCPPRRRARSCPARWRRAPAPVASSRITPLVPKHVDQEEAGEERPEDRARPCPRRRPGRSPRRSPWSGRGPARRRASPRPGRRCPWPRPGRRNSTETQNRMRRAQGQPTMPRPFVRNGPPSPNQGTPGCFWKKYSIGLRTIHFVGRLGQEDARREDRRHEEQVAGLRLVARCGSASLPAQPVAEAQPAEQDADHAGPSVEAGPEVPRDEPAGDHLQGHEPQAGDERQGRQVRQVDRRVVRPRSRPPARRDGPGRCGGRRGQAPQGVAEHRRWPGRCR